MCMFVSLTLDRRIRRITYGNLHLVKAKYRHFSFIADGNKIVSWGFNECFRTHPLASRFCHRFSDVHSELAALAAFPHRIKDLSLYTFVNVRVRRLDNLFGYAAPCLHCKLMLKTFGINEVIYSNNLDIWNKVLT